MNFSENRYPLFGIMLQRVTVRVVGNSVENFRALPPLPLARNSPSITQGARSLSRHVQAGGLIRGPMRDAD
jgi:hypothetical protein